jgi:hypothetical protein
MVAIEVARFLHVTSHCVLWYTRAGKLNPVGRNSKGWFLYDPKEVEQLAEARAKKFIEAGPPIKTRFQEEREHKAQLEDLDAQIARMMGE